MKKTIVALTCSATLIMTNNTFAINIDGVLNESEWQSAQVIKDFFITSPFALSTPEYQTEVRVFTDEKGIYFGFTNTQPKITQLSERVARDGYIEADYNKITIDFDNTGLAAYTFSIANGGSINDGVIRDENSLSLEWNGVWHAKTSSDENHWVSEVHIPWDIAPMVSINKKLRDIGLHVERNVASLSKTYSHSPIHKSKQRYLSDFSTIAIKDHAGSSLQTFGYITTRNDRVADKTSFDAGLDIFWKPNSHQQLSLAINPDFGHVESDNLVVNFSPTETFFSENRAFFTENQSLFDMRGADSLRLIHTRRIGGAPDIGDAIGADIKGAVKFTRVGDDVNYGFFSAIEDGDSVANGRKYYATRAMRKTDNYNVGYLLTYTDREDINRNALVQAIDYGYDFSQVLKLSGQLIHSRIETSNTDSYDSAAWFELEHQLSENWEQSFKAAYYGDKFEVNDLGFLPRNDLTSYYYKNTIKNPKFNENSMVKQHAMTLDITHKRNHSGIELITKTSFNDVWSFKDTSSIQWTLTLDKAGHDDLLTRGNNVVNLDKGFDLDVLYFGQSTSKFRYHIHNTIFDRTVSGKGFSLHAHPSYRFTDNYILTTGIWYQQSDNWLIWKNGNQLNAFDKKSLTARVNFDAIIDDKQDVSIKFEWIALRAKGKNVYDVADNGNLNKQAQIANDFSLSDVAMQIRYRYEIAPLSNVYLVYSRGGSTNINEDKPFSSLFSPGWDKRDGDNLSLKVRYQF